MGAKITAKINSYIVHLFPVWVIARSESGCNMNSEITKQIKNYSERAFLKGKQGERILET
jgi:hypothetical protein